MAKTVKRLASTQIGRITDRPEYLNVAKTGRKWVTPSFILQAAPPSSDSKEDNQPAKVGFTVSKKAGNAVQRSRIRRRLKEASRSVLPKKAPDDWRFVLIGRSTAVHYPFDKMCSDLAWALAKLASNADLKNKRGQ